MVVMRKILYLNCFLIIAIFCACGTDRDIAERRALMIPRKSEMPRNAKKFKEVTYRGQSKSQKKLAKRMKRYNRKHRR
jgi:hypothetical protein